MDIKRGILELSKEWKNNIDLETANRLEQYLLSKVVKETEVNVVRRNTVQVFMDFVEQGGFFIEDFELDKPQLFAILEYANWDLQKALDICAEMEDILKNVTLKYEV